jgi:hypothetical protein
MLLAASPREASPSLEAAPKLTRELQLNQSTLFSPLMDGTTTATCLFQFPLFVESGPVMDM